MFQAAQKMTDFIKATILLGPAQVAILLTRKTAHVLLHHAPFSSSAYLWLESASIVWSPGFNQKGKSGSFPTIQSKNAIDFFYLKKPAEFLPVIVTMGTVTLKISQQGSAACCDLIVVKNCDPLRQKQGLCSCGSRLTGCSPFFPEGN